ncbi:hypothetical protein AV530_005913 [Patagioenas fasciata monilis]|uniref:Uncharacterized protein n=1 Tax=Patagioenas fasciata monilis TaxID=372326 RepID=A0A1V4JN50_PATFA|nr:hypothetical protein AV530_005913 [Patagioenas fasciata monilis]
MVKQLSPLQPRADIHTASHGGPHVGASECAQREAEAHEEPALEQAPGRNFSPRREAGARAGFLAGPVAHGGPMLEQSVPEGLYPMERTHAGEVHKELQPMRRTHVGVGKEHEEERVSGMKHYGLIANPTPHPPALLGVGRRRGRDK